MGKQNSKPTCSSRPLIKEVKRLMDTAPAALATVIVHWLQSNQNFMPTASQFDSLIAEGSSEWCKLCNDQSYMNSFPDNHFNLETVLKADLRPLIILRNKSLLGFLAQKSLKT